jgi:hypothetical protein
MPPFAAPSGDEDASDGPPPASGLPPLDPPLLLEAPLEPPLDEEGGGVAASAGVLPVSVPDPALEHASATNGRSARRGERLIAHTIATDLPRREAAKSQRGPFEERDRAWAVAIKPHPEWGTTWRAHAGSDRVWLVDFQGEVEAPPPARTSTRRAR